MNLKAVKAIFKRNLAAYFGSPSGYLFICAFVLVSGLSAFWPHEFFNSNLANLDQLSLWFPVLLLFIVLFVIQTMTVAQRLAAGGEQR